MSLINEALKKAQGDRPARQQGGPSNPETDLTAEAHYTPREKGRRRSYLWGFVVSLLVVGTFTTLLTAYFVKQFLGSEESDPPPPPESVVRAPSGQPSVDPSDVAATTPAAASPPEPAAVSQQEPPTEPPAVQQPPAETTPPPGPPTPPNPAVVARLMELEIRGIMSKGTRVLIFDQATGKTKAYASGEALEGPMGLVVETISNSSIKFKDYAGQFHSKSF